MSEPNTTPQVPPVEPGPPAPPAPPAPPVPPVPPVPQYGEYAPGYTPPPPGSQAPPAPPAPPAYGAYGSAQSVSPGQPAQPGQPGTRTRKTWDLVLTIVFLVLGFFGMLIAFLYSALFGDPAFMDEMARAAGLTSFNGEVGAAQSIIVISHLVLFLVAVGGALPLLITKRVAFWVPLTTGVIAAVVFWGAFVAVFLSDPSLVNSVR